MIGWMHVVDTQGLGSMVAALFCKQNLMFTSFISTEQRPLILWIVKQHCATISCECSSVLWAKWKPACKTPLHTIAHESMFISDFICLLYHFTKQFYVPKQYACNRVWLFMFAPASLNRGTTSIWCLHPCSHELQLHLKQSMKTWPIYPVKTTQFWLFIENWVCNKSKMFWWMCTAVTSEPRRICLEISIK